VSSGRRIDLPDEAATRRLAERLGAAALAAAANRRLVIFLEGNLGSGKTTLVRAAIQGLGYAGAVKSPTYTLIESYEVKQGHVHHLDLYRVGDPEELDYLGLRDLLAEPALWLIEWPGRGTGWLPPPDLTLRLSYHDAGRQMAVLPWTAAGQDLAEALGRSI
jgi:tRNA threonylcarbamoyladenosine biosynthesis protein TsaE